MHLGHAPVIAPDEAEDDLGIDPAGVGIDPAHDAEVEDLDRAVPGDLDVALVHVAVEVAVAQGMLVEQLQHPRAQRLAVDAGGVDRGDVPGGDALHPLQRHHAAARQVPDHRRHAEARVAFGVGLELGRGAAFKPQVQLAPHHAVEMLDHVHRLQPAGRRRKRLDHPRGKVEGVDVAPEGPLDARAQHLDRHDLPGLAHHGPVHLRQRGRGHRFAQAVEHLVHGLADLALDLDPGLGGGEGGQLVLQHPKLGGELVAHHVGPGGQDLAELDVGRAKGGQGPHHRRQVRVAPVAQPAERPGQHPRRDPQPARRLEGVEHRGHGAGAFQRGTRADQPDDVVGPAHRVRSSTRNAGRPRPASGCDTSPARTRRRGSWQGRSPGRGTCGSIPPGTGSCRGRRSRSGPWRGSR